MKANLIYLMIPLSLFLGCTHGHKNTVKNIELIDQYVQAVENMDHETMASMLDDDYIGLGPSYGDTITKNQAIENWKWATEELYKSIKYNRSRSASVFIHEGENKGEWVSNWAELTIIYHWSDVQVNLWANSIYQIENGKIVKSYTFYNEADAYRQLGYEFY